MTRTERRHLRQHTAMVRRIVAVWRGATAADLAAGLDWYAEAHATAAALAAGTGTVTTAEAAGVIAALSPRAQWRVNVAWATRMVNAYATGGDMPAVSTTNNRATAWAILAGTLDGPRGIKTAAFMRAIMGDVSAVVVDVWAARAAGIGHNFGPAEYRRIAAAYTEAADRLGVAPRDLQAAVWVAVRGGAA